MAEKKTLTLDQAALVEAAQDITLIAWPMLYGATNPFDLDSRALLAEMRRWASEFERKWGAGEIAEDDYMLAVEEFATQKATEYREPLLKRYLDDMGIDYTDISCAYECQDGKYLADILSKVIPEGDGADVVDELGETLLIMVKEGPAPRDFYIDCIANVYGRVVFYGYYDRADDMSVLDLATVQWLPALSSNLEHGIRGIFE